MIPTLIEIPLPFGWGSLPLHSFGLSMVLAFLAAWKSLSLCLEADGEDPAIAERMVTWAAIGGIVGARLCYILSFPQGIFNDPLRTIFGGAGFVFYGGFIGGAFAVWWLLHRAKKDFFHYADLTAPSLAIGYAVGRIGCQISGDGDYGIASDLPWAMSYAHGVLPTPPGVLVHPTPVYETFMALAIAALVMHKPFRRRFSGKGQIFGIYLLLSAIARFSVEFIRIEPQVASMFTQAQVIAMGIATVGLFLFFRTAKEDKA